MNGLRSRWLTYSLAATMLWAGCQPDRGENAQYVIDTIEYIRTSDLTETEKMAEYRVLEAWADQRRGELEMEISGLKAHLSVYSVVIEMGLEEEMDLMQELEDYRKDLTDLNELEEQLDQLVGK